jgi:coenzyme F420-reducing hydrogenase gamma subunit
MEPEDRVKLVEHHDLCLGCLTPGHGRAARSCPYTASGCVPEISV